MQNAQTNTSPVLVTGATGFIASHLVKILLERGFKVRGTVRSLAKKQNYDFLYSLVPEKKDNLELVEATLDEQSGWSSAVEGCEYVFHVASPVPKNNVANQEFIQSAVNGTRFVLDASLEKRVKKVVVTSSIATIWFGNTKEVLTEDDWAVEEILEGYGLSKVKAEKLVWEFYEQNKDKIQVAVINPASVLGPAFSQGETTSASILGDILNGTSSGVIDVMIGAVDVRDVAEAHFQAMFRDKANGRRYIINGVNAHWRDIVRILKKEYEGKGFRISDKPVSKEEVEAKGSVAEKLFAPLIGSTTKFNNERSLRELNLTYHSLEDTLIASADNLIELGTVSKPLVN